MKLTKATKVLQLKNDVISEVALTREKWVYADADGQFVVAKGPSDKDAETVCVQPSRNWPRVPDTDVMCVYCVRPLWTANQRVRVCHCGHVVHTHCMPFYTKRMARCRVCNGQLGMFSMGAYFK